MTRTFKPGDMVRDAVPMMASGLWRIGYKRGRLWQCYPVDSLARGCARQEIARMDGEMVADIVATLLAAVTRHRRQKRWRG